MANLFVKNVKKKFHLVDFGMKQKTQHGCVLKNMCLELIYCQKLKRIMRMSERSESKRLGAKQHKNSGRNTKKGDATWNNFTVDFKESSKSFTLNKDVWAKVVTDAIKNNNDPALVIVLGEESKKVRLAIIEVEILEQMFGESWNQQ
jgi:outer membrane phospholipase A